MTPLDMITMATTAGTEPQLARVLERWETSPEPMFDSVRCLRLPGAVRAHIHSILLAARTKVCATSSPPSPPLALPSPTQASRPRFEHRPMH